MAWVDGKWVAEDDSVASNLNGLMATNSDYMKQARAAGTRAAGKRGLLNSSIASGASEASAIAAALPIASQDASTSASKNQAVLTGDLDLRNQTALGEQNLKSQTTLNEQQNAAELLRQKEAAGYQLTLQEKSDLAAMDRQNAQIASTEKTALLSADTQLASAKISANSEATGQYLNAIANLSANSKLKAADRNAYIAEFQRVAAQAKTYSDTISSATISW